MKETVVSLLNTTIFFTKRTRSCLGFQARAAKPSERAGEKAPHPPACVAAGRVTKSPVLLVFSVTQFKMDQNKNQNRSIDKVQNLGNERR